VSSWVELHALTAKQARVLLNKACTDSSFPAGQIMLSTDVSCLSAAVGGLQEAFQHTQMCQGSCFMLWAAASWPCLGSVPAGYHRGTYMQQSCMWLTYSQCCMSCT
jgi:hypothetical protein